MTVWKALSNFITYTSPRVREKLQNVSCESCIDRCKLPYKSETKNLVHIIRTRSIKRKPIEMNYIISKLLVKDN